MYVSNDGTTKRIVVTVVLYQFDNEGQMTIQKMQENSLLTNTILATLLRASSQPLFRALNGEYAEASGERLLLVHNFPCATKIVSSN
jgi:hypothetical protein